MRQSGSSHRAWVCRDCGHPVAPMNQSIGRCLGCATRVSLEDAEIEIAGVDAAAVRSVLESLGPLLFERKRVKRLDLSRAKIFLSYRREDTGPIAGRICDHLMARFGPQSVFMDIDSIPTGEDFRSCIDGVLSSCLCMLALIGDRWLQDESGRMRLHDADDFLRLEIETGLRRALSVIPVLIGKSSMPSATQLPASIADLANLNAARVDPGRDFRHHMDCLVKDVAERCRLTNG